MSIRVRNLLILLLATLVLAWVWPFAASTSWNFRTAAAPDETRRSDAQASAQPELANTSTPGIPDSSSSDGNTAAAAADPASSPDPAATRPDPRASLSRADAHELMRRVIAERDCEQAEYSASDHSAATLEWHYWRWLPPEQAAHERAARMAAATRLRQGCAQFPSDADAVGRRHRERAADEVAALAAGDLQARLRVNPREPGRPTDAELEQTRALLYDVLLSGDLDLIAQIGMRERWLDLQSRADPLTHVRPEIWQLVACDLGRDCGPYSLALARRCLYVTSSACGTDNVDAAIRLTQSEGMYRLMDQRRRELVARIRSGQIAGMFDPPPPPPPGDS